MSTVFFLEGTGFANVLLFACDCELFMFCYSTKCRHGGFRSSSRRSWMQYHLNNITYLACDAAWFIITQCVFVGQRSTGPPTKPGFSHVFFDGVWVPRHCHLWLAQLGFKRLVMFSNIIDLAALDTIEWEQNLNWIELNNETIVFCL